MTKKYLLTSPLKTKKLGEGFARRLLKQKPKKNALVICLIGNLGSGKTTFLQGFAKGLGIKEKIISPTFVLMRKFQFSKFRNFYHIDCYRIQKPREILNLGFKKIISNPKNIVAIEWAEKIFWIIPKNKILINFQFIDKKTRKIIFN